MFKLKTRYFLSTVTLFILLTMIYLSQENKSFIRLLKDIEISSFSTYDINDSRSGQFYDAMDVISDSIIL
ncbi:unnamed protein product [Rhizophagus irregularis]|uniref:Uncharacterized protein n=2 Tax=Rhizophagus irregularis TaxID=588596 RepID=A0A2N1NFB0_9GLOM|nr:hypothetical protein GLOIN_2v1587645 [Rhizophagus irregularis DAOM 181602=DAOM 197198]PKK72520.1 hypothetical protein RhiirC2_378991 [Rhizophagus irregularis]RGB36806.1 hypothetical protein C1646_696471 [Rhizophagus diaphanus] [Rhizophagus sp. MUCL 43196]POG73242.1 hypothetical protein GLOIN_2v1587645 [Rhizophagus irregularis DAOM 181602=DAOM 197198]CAB4421085.1 unnamed protein product [Rhizophagus irregularis]CAB4470498.1 unnamed protein product [Rhizophagus irregularis]|eukprot:XP_025180108.1 hypothetical protein GLOIN_2v1587645 [Rhizophagus irregularis DAOM 181602=DAOM 197198]